LLQARVCPSQAVAIEDSPAGVAAARAVDVPVVLTRSSYFAGSAFPGVMAVGPGLDQRTGWQPGVPVESGSASGIRLADLERWVALTRRSPAWEPER
jgi:hypothetical protein